MNDREKRTLDMFKRVRAFGASHPTLTTDGSQSGDLFNAVHSIANEMEERAVVESAARGRARQGTSSKRVARAAILAALGILRRTARSMSVASPGLADKFRLPLKGDEQELLATARAIVNEAELHKAEFRRLEVREEVFESLADNIAAFESALNGQYAGREESTAAGASIDNAVERGLKFLRQLDPVVRNKFQNNPAGLAAWRCASRIERAARRNNTPTPPEPETPDQ